VRCIIADYWIGIDVRIQARARTINDRGTRKKPIEAVYENGLESASRKHTILKHGILIPSSSNKMLKKCVMHCPMADSFVLTIHEPALRMLAHFLNPVSWQNA
jgi:hypothetical protein